MLGQANSDLSARFAKSYTTAAFGYARAASAAYAALANQTLDFWVNAGKGATRSDYTPSAPYLVTGPRTFRSPLALAAPEPRMPFDFMGMSNAWAASPMFAPVRAWWGLFPLEGNPASWPMAYAMMNAGVPRSVALPTAEANLAAMEAAEVAKASLAGVFSSYRSESGFAVSHAVTPQTVLNNLFFLPLTSTKKLPWVQ